MLRPHVDAGSVSALARYVDLGLSVPVNPYLLLVVRKRAVPGTVTHHSLVSDIGGFALCPGFRALFISAFHVRLLVYIYR